MKKQNKRKDIRERIDNALYHISPEVRETCIQVGMAIHSELGDGGYSTWDSWLKRSNKYNESDMKRAWNSFGKGNITIATLFYIAKNRSRI